MTMVEGNERLVYMAWREPLKYWHWLVRLRGVEIFYDNNIKYKIVIDEPWLIPIKGWLKVRW